MGVDDFEAPADRRWAKITLSDLDGARKLLLENHPGAAASLHDLGFQRRLSDAYARGLTRAGQAASYEAYMATLAGFATDMGDKHIWSRPTFAVAFPLWSGIIVSLRGSRILVTDTDEQHAALMGAQLLSCDAIAAGDLARDNLGGFRADWSVGAQRVQTMPWLLIDEHNPFIHRASVCTFSRGTEQHAETLRWQRIRRETLLPRLKRAVGAGAAGFGIRSVGNGMWIALQDLSAPQTADVVAAAQAQQAALRSAEFVVLDLRGNGGGSSEVGRQIADVLIGHDAVAARLGESSQSNCGGADGAWRTSPGNIADMEYLLSTQLAGGSEARRIFTEVLNDAKQARARGEEFSASIHCPVDEMRAGALEHSALQGTLYVLTDNVCFSSCLAVTHDFRRLGAVHIGQTTDAATHFAEVREAYLPSGYSLFSTLQSVNDAQGPNRVGPFEPAIAYDGDIADTAALEDWVLTWQAAKRAR